MKIRLDTSARVSPLRLTLLAVALAAFLYPGKLPAQAAGTAPAAPTLLTVKRVGDTATVFWSAPTSYTDGTALGTAVLTYTVYAAAPGATWKVLSGGINTLTYTTAALPKGSQCYAITDSVAGLESAATPALCLGVSTAANPPAAAGIR